MVLVQGSAEVDDRDLEANRQRYAREAAEKLPAMKGRQAPDPLKRPSWPGTSCASTSTSGPSVCTSGRTADLAAEPSCTTRTWRRCAPATRRSPTVFTPTPSGGDQRLAPRLDELGTTLSESGAVDRLSGRLPVAMRVPARSTQPTAGSGSRSAPPGVPLAARAGLPDRPRARPGIRLERTSRSAATSCCETGVGPDPPQARRGPRGPGLKAGVPPRQRRQGEPVPPHGQAGTGAARLTDHTRRPIKPPRTPPARSRESPR